MNIFKTIKNLFVDEELDRLIQTSNALIAESERLGAEVLRTGLYLQRYNTPMEYIEELEQPEANYARLFKK